MAGKTNSNPLLSANGTQHHIRDISLPEGGIGIMSTFDNRHNENRRMSSDRRQLTDNNFKEPERRNSVERRSRKERRKST
ncbi:MAG: hypothetical protein KKD47_09830 [Proteobacteria bacterium]|nr:hypothetical protein [Pseudomonadota bacterium]